MIYYNIHDIQTMIKRLAIYLELNCMKTARTANSLMFDNRVRTESEKVCCNDVHVTFNVEVCCAKKRHAYGKFAI